MTTSNTVNTRKRWLSIALRAIAFKVNRGMRASMKDSPAPNLLHSLLHANRATGT